MKLTFEELLPVLQETTMFDTNTIASAVATDDQTKAPGRFPYPMDNILTDFADAYLHLRNIRFMLDVASKNKALPELDRRRLAQLRGQIGGMSQNVKKIATEIEQDFAR